jgi:O-antigen ligase
MISRGADVLRRLPGVSLSTGIVLLATFGFAPLFGWTLASALTIERFMPWAAFILVAGIAVVPVIVRWPVITTFAPYAFIATSLDAFPLMPGGASLSKPVGFIAGAVLLGAGLVERRLGRPPAATAWWTLFMLWCVVTIIWALDDALAFRKLPSALSLFFLYIAAVAFRPSRRELHWVCAASVLGGVFAASLAYFFGLNELASGDAARGRLALGDMAETNPNTLGAVLLMPLGFAIAGFLMSRGWLQRLVIVGCMGMISMGIFISMSRTAVVSTIAMVAVFVYRLKAGKHIIGALVLLVVVAAAAPQKFYDRMETTVTTDHTGSGRTNIWMVGLDGLREHALIGAGLDNFREVHERLASFAKGSHNTYLGVAVDLGVPGVLLMMGAVASGFLAILKARRGANPSVTLVACEAVGVGMLMGAIFADRLWTKSFWLLWVVLAWTVSSERQVAEENGSASRTA